MHERNKWNVFRLPSEKQTAKEVLTIIPCKKYVVTPKMFCAVSTVILQHM